MFTKQRFRTRRWFRVSYLTSLITAKTLTQVHDAHPDIKLEIFIQPGKKEPPNDSLDNFLAKYTEQSRVGHLPKEKYHGKIVSEWEKAVAAASSKPELVDVTSAVSGFLSTKDTSELVNPFPSDLQAILTSRLQQTIQTAGNLTATLLKHYVSSKLENILDREAKTPHSTLSATIESRLGGGEGENAKGPDMKIWSKLEGHKKVRMNLHIRCILPCGIGGLGFSRDDLSPHYPVFVLGIRPANHSGVDRGCDRAQGRPFSFSWSKVQDILCQRRENFYR